MQRAIPPQSWQSVPDSHSAKLDPGPPSSQKPSEAKVGFPTHRLLHVQCAGSCGVVGGGDCPEAAARSSPARIRVAGRISTRVAKLVTDTLSSSRDCSRHQSARSNKVVTSIKVGMHSEKVSALRIRTPPLSFADATRTDVGIGSALWERLNKSHTISNRHVRKPAEVEGSRR